MKSKIRNCIISASSKLAFVLLFVFFMSGIQYSYASSNEKKAEVAAQQEVMVKGKVVDETNVPLPGVSVVIKGTSSGTVTNVDGNFEIMASAGAVIQFSFIGFIKEEVTISEGNVTLNVVLEEKNESLEEVVVVGYGVQKKETVTGAMSTVSSDEITEQPVSNVSQALGGRLPGLLSNQSGGRPGKDASTIKIRGIGTLDAGSGSDPLVMIDGIERSQSDLNFLDPNEIESLSILKDASSTAVFGVRGANGVILVTTKRGSVGPAKMSYKSNVAVMIPDFSIDFANSYEQTGLLNEYQGFAAETDNPIAPYPMSEREKFLGVINGNPLDPTDPFFYPSTDYAELMLKDRAFQHQHNLTVSGGTSKVKYFASLGYYNQGGMFKQIDPDNEKTTSYERYNYRTNVDVALTNTTDLAINVGGSFNKNVSLGLGGSEPSRSFYWASQVHSSPWEGYTHDGKLVMLKENANSVLLNSDMRGYAVEYENTADYSFKVKQNLDIIAKGLSFKGTVSFVSYFRNFIRRDKDAKSLPFYTPSIGDDGEVNFYQAKEDNFPYNWVSQGKNRKEYYEAALEYDNTFNDSHTVTALLLGNAEKLHFKLNNSDYNDIPRSYMGFVGRVTYSYKNRYLAEFNYGYNGSENFAEGKRFGSFPAYSLGWTFTEEPWLGVLSDNNIVSYGKLRFSYGKVGNDKMRNGNIDQRFLYLPDTYSMWTNGDPSWYNNYRVRFGLPGEVTTYPLAVPGRVGNPDITWEKAVKINYGADLSFFKDLLSIKFDYFTEDRTDILIDQRVVPVYQQAGNLALNLGQVQNSGYEFEIGLNKKFSDKTRCWVEVNYTHARNKIIEIDEPQQPYDYQQQTGTSVGELYGYQQEDFFRTVEEAEVYKEELWQTYQELNPEANRDDYQAYQIFALGSDVSAGDLKFIDRNRDGLINENDKGYLGTTRFPETMFGLKAGIEHEGWTLSFMLQGASDYAINARTNNSPTPDKGSVLDFVLNRYTPERYEAGETIEYPRLVATNNNWKEVGSYWFRDATYLRLKNVELGYTFDSDTKFVEKLGMDNVRIYTNGLNLLTFSDIKYIDPETTNGQLKYPRARVINLGIQVKF